MASALDKVKAAIRSIPDFPKPGIMFRDVTTLLLEPAAFQACVDLFAERYQGQNIDAIVACESRGFIFGAPLALKLGVPFVPLRKPGKLPGKTIGVDFKTEYSTDRFEMHVDALKAGQNVVVIDDLIATGGTLEASCRLVEEVGASVVECGCVIELPALRGREKLPNRRVYTMIEFDGE